MSISVKSISLSVNGTPSNQFNIELDGAKYSIEDVKMTQRLLEPCRLEFKLRKTPQEDISEIQFTTCGSIIGKDVTLSMQTDSVEQEISGFAAGSQNADVEFEGFVTQAKATRCETEFAILVTAETKDTILKDHPEFSQYKEKTLSDIVNDIIGRGGVEGEVQPKMEDPIFYTVQYKENNYQFLQRMAKRYGEWMFNNGKKFHFGKFGDQETITLAYPSQDMSEYSARLKTFHTKQKSFVWGYNDQQIYSTYKGDEQEDSGNKLNDATFAASNEKYKHETMDELMSGRLETEDEAEQEGENSVSYEEGAIADKHGRRANMLVYDGTTFCSKMKIGAKLTIKDNFTSSGSLSDTSEVQQDEILIIEVVHKFNIDEQYSNTFKGITAGIDYPPYLDPLIYPVCDHPIRATVKDTEDPKHWGRVRVRYSIPALRADSPLFYDGSEDKPEALTPWIHVSQAYNGYGDHASGMHLIPELHSEVLVAFEDGNMERPFVLCAYHSSIFSKVEEQWYPGDNKVKALRTPSGHTIEIIDKQTAISVEPGGHIHIYDNRTQIYDVLLDVDKKLISMDCKGDINIHADDDINISAGGNINANAGENINTDAGACIRNKAKQHVSNSAGGDFNAGAGGTFNGSAGGEVLINAGSNFSAKASAKMDLTSEDEMKIHSATTIGIDSSEEMSISAEKDMTVLAHKGFILTVEEDANATYNSNLNVTVLKSSDTQIAFNYKLKAMEITQHGETSLKQYALNYEINADAKASMTATAAINLMAPIIKEN
ncbi:MAG: phage baseplate assembly protein V [Prevotella sp.]|nr:phage baseplate assembly protein V [Prevotella sp.]